MITLATLKDATEQQVFDQVCKHLKTQGVQSKKPSSDDCAYRGDGRLMCAAGCLISDSEYKEVMDDANDQSWCGLVRQELVPPFHKDLIIDLQVTHDNAPPDKWEYVLLDLAEQRGLQFNWDNF